MRQRVALVAIAVALAVASSAHARPLYFDNLTSIYDIQPGEDLYACGVCHFKWTGTGGRNPYGNAVEQQLYIGKPIASAILAVAGDDADGDGYTNGDELGTYGTLPGYNCTNWTSAVDPPAYFQSIITPGVASCLEPHDIRVEPANLTFQTTVGQTSMGTVDIVNNGLTTPLEVTSVAFLPGTPASFSITAPAVPFTIPVGGTVAVTVGYAPTSPGLLNVTLRVSSDDPDEPDVDVAIGAISFTNPLAPAADRAACFADVEHQMERYTKTHLKEWSTCFVAELAGLACDTGKRDLRIGQAEARLRAYIGGPNDRNCAPESLTPVRLGIPSTCGGGCGAIAVTNLSKFVDCLVCRQQEATNAMLAAVVGAAPPDLPGNILGAAAWRCNRTLVRGMEKGIRKMQSTLGDCEVDAIITSADCGTTEDAALTLLASRIDTAATRCTDTTDMLGCLFEPGPDPQCLGTAARSVAGTIVGATLGLE